MLNFTISPSQARKIEVLFNNALFIQNMAETCHAFLPKSRLPHLDLCRLCQGPLPGSHHLLSGAFRTPSLRAFLPPTRFQDIRPLAPAVSIDLPLLSAVGSKSDVSMHDRDDTARAFDASGLEHTN